MYARGNGNENKIKYCMSLRAEVLHTKGGALYATLYIRIFSLAPSAFEAHPVLVLMHESHPEVYS